MGVHTRELISDDTIIRVIWAPVLMQEREFQVT